MSKAAAVPGQYIKQTVVEWLNQVDYSDDPFYVPDAFALEFLNFIKLVNGAQGEENASPVIHLRMLDNVHGVDPKIINLCFRGSAKTTVMGEYLFLYIATYGSIPGFGAIDLAIYVSDSIENGVKNMRKNLEYRWENSEFLQTFVPQIRFTDIRWEFINADGKRFIVKGYGAKALALDTRLYSEGGGFTTIGSCRIGDRIYGPEGVPATIIAKSEVFHKPMYAIELEDGRTLKVSEDHINSVLVNTDPNNLANWEDKNLSTKELLQLGWKHSKLGNKNHQGVSNKCVLKVRNTVALEYPEREFLVDPYTMGLLLGDGSIKKKASGIVLTGDRPDMDYYRTQIPYELGADYADKRRTNVITYAIKGINQQIRDYLLDVHGNHKFIPAEYYFGSIEQRLSLLQGLLDTDGSVYGSGRITFVSASRQLTDDVAGLVRSLGGKAKPQITKNNAYLIEIWMGINPFRLPRKAARFVYDRRHWSNCNVVDIRRIANEPSQCIAIDSPSHQFLAGDYFRTHNTGVRGAKEMGKRPQLAVMDDLISDEDARSDTVIAAVEDTVNKAVNFALHPTRSKTIWSGTPFNARDPLYKAVESGAYKVNVYPICNEFPCAEEDFKGAWPDRFPYHYVKAQYDFAKAQGKISAFNQELMLRIISDDDRLILDSEILWYSRSQLLQNKQKFNFYITTDFATSGKQSADFSVIAVWALNSKGFWFLVDGICKRQTMDKNVTDLFRLAQLYSPQSVGIEISGQQGGFIPWIQAQMLERNSFFNLASDKAGNQQGIRPMTNKTVRFNIVVPWFKAHLMFFPQELKETPFIQEMISELQLVTPSGFKSKHDDCLDAVSMLGSLTTWRPSEEVAMKQASSDYWEIEEENLDEGRLSSYVV